MSDDEKTRSVRALSTQSVIAISNRAAKAVYASLAESGIDAPIVYSHDEGGMRFVVAAKAGDGDRARDWLKTFGRSYGPVQIFVEERM